MRSTPNPHFIDYSTSNNSKILQDKAILTMADRYKVAYDLLINAIFNDLERPPNPDFKVTPIFDAEYLGRGRPPQDRHVFSPTVVN